MYNVRYWFMIGLLFMISSSLFASNLAECIWLHDRLQSQIKQMKNPLHPNFKSSFHHSQIRAFESEICDLEIRIAEMAKKKEQMIAEMEKKKEERAGNLLSGKYSSVPQQTLDQCAGLKKDKSKQNNDSKSDGTPDRIEARRKDAHWKKRYEEVSNQVSSQRACLGLVACWTSICSTGIWMSICLPAILRGNETYFYTVCNDAPYSVKIECKKSNGHHDHKEVFNGYCVHMSDFAPLKWLYVASPDGSKEYAQQQDLETSSNFIVFEVKENRLAIIPEEDQTLAPTSQPTSAPMGGIGASWREQESLYSSHAEKPSESSGWVSIEPSKNDTFLDAEVQKNILHTYLRRRNINSK